MLNEQQAPAEDVNEEGLAPDPYEHRVNGFLGAEFLMWLWWRAEREQGQVHLADLGPVAFWLDDELVLSTPGPDSATARWSGGAPTAGPEGLGSVAAGKRVDKLRLGVRVENARAEFSVVLDAERLDIHGLKMPKEDGGEPLERLTERLHYLEVIRSVVDALFAGFLRARTHERWDSDWAPEIREWVRTSVAGD